MEAAAVVDTFMANMFLHPVFVRHVVRYWCHSCTPLLLEPGEWEAGMGTGPESPGFALLRTDFGHLVQLLATPWADLQMHGETMVLPTATATNPRPVCVLTLVLASRPPHQERQSLSLSDRLWVQNENAPIKGPLLWASGLVAQAMHTITMHLRHYWGNVGSGEMRNTHVHTTFLHMDRARAVAHPAVLIGHACHLIIEGLRQHDVPMDLIASVLRLMSQCMARIVWLPTVSPEERRVTLALGTILGDPDTAVTRVLEQLDCFVANMDRLCKQQYATLRAQHTGSTSHLPPTTDEATYFAHVLQHEPD